VPLIPANQIQQISTPALVVPSCLSNNIALKHFTSTPILASSHYHRKRCKTWGCILCVTESLRTIQLLNSTRALLMAALYLHNAIFSPEASQDPASRHRHELSLQSSVTAAPNYRTSFSEFSHLTESLLHPDTSGSPAYADLLSRQPAHPSGPQPGWDLGLSLVSDSPTIRERRDMWQRAVKIRLKRLSLTKGMLELLMVSI